ncbi:hypothetical protein EBR03_08700 [bacterium]|nr:hypothetical protein [bacterium]
MKILLPPQRKGPPKTHGTTLLMNKMKHSEHLVLRARLPILRLRKNQALISAFLCELSEKFKIKIYNNSC